MVFNQEFTEVKDRMGGPNTMYKIKLIIIIINYKISHNKCINYYAHMYIYIYIKIWKQIYYNTLLV